MDRARTSPSYHQSTRIRLIVRIPLYHLTTFESGANILGRHPTFEHPLDRVDPEDEASLRWDHDLLLAPVTAKSMLRLLLHPPNSTFGASFVPGAASKKGFFSKWKSFAVTRPGNFAIVAL